MSGTQCHSPESVPRKTQNVHHMQHLMCGLQTNFRFMLIKCGKWVFLTIRVAIMAIDCPWICDVLQYCL